MGIPTKKHTAATATDAPFHTSKTDLAALLTSQGVAMIGAEIERGRVRFDFANADGEASRLAREHAVAGIVVNSRALTMALRAVEDTLWQVRREAGLAR